jgi:uncharacterized membrane protein YbaN (DUF454 family)
MRVIFAILGFLFLGLGAIGVVLPMLPTTPFIMVSAVCFAKSSKKINDWFLGTSLYKNHFEPLVRNKEMTYKSKIMVMISVTILMTICFIIMKNVLMAKIVIFIVWACHMVYFLFRIRTIRNEE